jgi:hypothetical protein
MKFKIFHQLGHNDVWSIQSINQENTGDGIIISPKNRKAKNVEGLGASIKAKAIFDPQMFFPRYIVKKMNTYDFYPSLMPGGYDTDRLNEYSPIFMEKCIEFQVRNNFGFLVIPTRFYDNLTNVDELIEYHNKNFVDPSLTTINNTKTDKEILFQWVLTSNILTNKDYSETLLTWITGIQKIGGVYLIIDPPSRYGQIDDPKFLYLLMVFVNELFKNDLKVVLGYLNSESLLLSLANPSIVSIGSAYQNIRRFDPKNFMSDLEQDVKTPTFKMYSPKLLDWFDFPYMELIKERIPDDITYWGENRYSKIMFDPNYQGRSIHKVEPHKHYFIEISKQLRDLSALDGERRYNRLNDIIESAKSGYEQVRGVNIELGNRDAFLPAWQTAAKSFASEQGWI